MAEERIYFTSITPVPNTGMNFTPWMNDNVTDLVTSVWGATNNQWCDVKIKLQKKAKITKVSLYDYQGIFTTNPVKIYAVDGNQKTLLGNFYGYQYMQWVDITLPGTTLADTIVVTKYANDIPMKIKVFGNPDTPVVTPAPTTGSGATASTQPSNTTIGTALTATSTSSSPAAIIGKIPVDGKRWYQLVNATNNMEGLFDGNTSTQVHTGWGKVLANYDAYYPVLDGEVIKIDSIKFFDGAGSNVNDPFSVYVIDNQWNKTLIATYTGSQYNVWVGPNPATPLNAANRFALAIPATNVKYIVVNTSSAYPTEMELYGFYVPPPALTPAAVKSIKMKDMMGVNAFEWDFENPNSPLVIDQARLNAAKSFTGIRHYIDWEKLELTEGNYTFNPCHSGGWNYDTLYAACKANGIEVLADLKTIPGWMQNTYPVAERDLENVPVKYGMNFSDPGSYIGQAKVAFQFAARYGSNANVSSSLLSVNPAQRWANDPMNVVKKGLGYIKYMECDNERDKWWKGRKAYQTGREYAANMSAFYDGHKNTMGPGVGVKNADPNMKVVMGGLAATSTDYLKGMIDWCKENRGYNPDGSINLCWDVINYHVYANDAGNSQAGTSTRGAAPEVAQADVIAKNFIAVAHQFCGDMPVWVTETGYDVNQGSSLKAIAIGSKSILQTQADWILRTALLHARTGVERVFFYQMYDDNIASTTKFASSGLINPDRTRKPAADYIYQTTKLLGEYAYKQTLSTSPMVDRYELNGKSAYALVKPTENGSSVSYTLTIPGATSFKIYTPTIGQDSMSVQVVNVTGGSMQLTVTETPMFVIPVIPGQQKLAAPESQPSTGSIWEESIKLFPNPAADYVNISLRNNDEGVVYVRLMNVAGQQFNKLIFNKEVQEMTQSVDLSSLQPGLYLMEIGQGKNRTVKTLFKER